MIFNDITLTKNILENDISNIKGFILVDKTHALIDIETLKQIEKLTETIIDLIIDSIKPENLQKLKQYSDLIYKILG